MQKQKTENLSIIRRPVCNLIAAGLQSKSDKVRMFYERMLTSCSDKTIDRVEGILKSKKERNEKALNRAEYVNFVTSANACTKDGVFSVMHKSD